jgi:hypothetical protein
MPAHEQDKDTTNTTLLNNQIPTSDLIGNQVAYQGPFSCLFSNNKRKSSKQIKLKLYTKKEVTYFHTNDASD